MQPIPWLVTGALVLSLMVPGQVRAGFSAGVKAGVIAPPPASAAAVAPAPVVEPEQVYTYELLSRDLAELAVRYPGLVTLRSLGRSTFGREIWALSLGTGPATVLINGAHHGSEWLTANLVAAMADRYAFDAASGVEGVAERLRQATIWFIPMVNPDGVSLSQMGLESAPAEAREGLLAMNGGSHDFRRWKANGEGVDLNRQYPADWEHVAANAPGPSYSHWKGTAPLTAPESRALYEFTLEVGPQIVIAYHSAGRVIFWHFHTAPEAEERDLRIAERLGDLTGYGLMPREENPSGGGYKDWFVQTVGRPGYTLEIGRYTDGGPLPLSAFAEEWERNRLVGLVAADEAVALDKADAGQGISP